MEKTSGKSLLKLSGKVWYISFSSNFQYESPDKKKYQKKIKATDFKLAAVEQESKIH